MAAYDGVGDGESSIELVGVIHIDAANSDLNSFTLHESHGFAALLVMRLPARRIRGFRLAAIQRLPSLWTPRVRIATCAN